MAGIGFSGNDWLGIGAGTSAAYAGTAECGSRPNCWAALSKDCKSRQEAYRDCVDRNTTMQEKILEAQLQQMQNGGLRTQPKKGISITTLLLIAGGVLLLIFLLRR